MPGTTIAKTPAYEHRGPGGWELYSAADNAVIAAALGGKTVWQANTSVRLDGTPFEIRFGAAAVSPKVAQPPSTGILQVNTANGNSRPVRAATTTTIASAAAASTSQTHSQPAAATSVRMVSVYEHKGPGGWEAYSPEQNQQIAAALGHGSPWDVNAAIRFDGTPFEIRFGAAAVSRKVSRPPVSGMLQVNTRNDNSRVVRDAEMPYGEHAGITNFDEEVPRDTFGNVEGSEYDLSPDNCNAFRGQIVAVLQLYSTQRGEAFTFASPKAALERKGFQVHLWTSLPGLKEFRAMLDRACQLWVVSGETLLLTDGHVDAIRSLMAEKKGLFIWGDNDPYTADANKLLAGLDETRGLKMSGNFMADTVLAEAHPTGKQKKGAKQGATWSKGAPGFSNHLVTTGIESLYEGITIASIEPEGKHTRADELVALIRSSDGKVVTACQEVEGRRLMIDGGFTRLYEDRWEKTAGTARFVTNAACWLFNFEGRS